MDFTFSQDQQLFCDSVKDFLRAEVTPDKLRQLWATDSGRSEQLWQQLVTLGLTGMLVPEVYGGMGMNELDFVLLAQQCGYVALAEPVVETALVVTPLLNTLAEKDPRCAELLSQIAAGKIKIAVGHNANDLISDAHIADWLILPNGDQIHLLAKDQVSLTQQASVDPLRRLYSVTWQPSDNTVLLGGTDGVALLAATLNRGALGAAAQLVGLTEAMMDMTVRYTGERQQFGRPIGSNQALKHSLANCAVKLEFAKPPLYRAAFTLSEFPLRADFAVSHAKVTAGEAALLTAKNAIQAHGAMGYTWECDLHITMKRAWALDKFWGHSGFHKGRLHQWLLNPDAKIGADKTFGVQL